MYLQYKRIYITTYDDDTYNTMWTIKLLFLLLLIPCIGIGAFIKYKKMKKKKAAAAAAAAAAEANGTIYVIPVPVGDENIEDTPPPKYSSPPSDETSSDQNSTRLAPCEVSVEQPDVAVPQPAVVKS